MDIPASEVGYTSATTGKGDHEAHKGHVVALDKNNKKTFRKCRYSVIIRALFITSILLFQK
jgi:hypothetical protein